MSTIPKIPPPPLLMNINPLLNSQIIKKSKINFYLMKYLCRNFKIIKFNIFK